MQQQPVTDPSQDGLVISQNPIGGTQARKGVVVTLAVGQLTAPTTTTETTTATTTTAATTTTTTPANP